VVERLLVRDLLEYASATPSGTLTVEKLV